MASDPNVTVLPVPVAAQKNLAEIKNQMVSLQAQLQQFIDGMLIGMGFDISQHPSVDLDSMTITIQNKGAGE